MDLLAYGEAAPDGGASAAITVAVAAELCTMAARLSADHLAAASELAEQSERARRRVSPLAQADAVAYGGVIAARREGRSVQDALSEAADVPLAVAEIGAEVSGIAFWLAQDGNPNLRGDALTATLLAEAGTRAAAALAEMNLSAAGTFDDRLKRANELTERAVEVRRNIEDED